MKSIELISGLEILSKVESYKIKGGTDNSQYITLVLDLATIDTSSNNRNFSKSEKADFISKANSAFADSSK